MLSIQLEKCCKICVSSVINCLRPHTVMSESNWAPTEVMVSLIDQFVYFALKSPVAKWGLRLDVSTRSFSNYILQQQGTLLSKG